MDDIGGTGAFDPVVDILPPMPIEYKQPGTAQFTQTLDNAEAIIADIKAKIESCINGCMLENVSAYVDTCGCIQGCFANVLDKAQGVINKVGDKIQGRLIQIMSEAYGHAQALGCTIPSSADIISSGPGLSIHPPVQSPPQTGYTCVGNCAWRSDLNLYYYVGEGPVWAGDVFLGKFDTPNDAITACEADHCARHCEYTTGYGVNIYGCSGGVDSNGIVCSSTSGYVNGQPNRCGMPVCNFPGNISNYNSFTWLIRNDTTFDYAIWSQSSSGTYNGPTTGGWTMIKSVTVNSIWQAETAAYSDAVLNSLTNYEMQYKIFSQGNLPPSCNYGAAGGGGGGGGGSGCDTVIVDCPTPTITFNPVINVAPCGSDTTGSGGGTGTTGTGTTTAAQPIELGAGSGEFTETNVPYVPDGLGESHCSKIVNISNNLVDMGQSILTGNFIDPSEMIDFLVVAGLIVDDIQKALVVNIAGLLKAQQYFVTLSSLNTAVTNAQLTDFARVSAIYAVKAMFEFMQSVNLGELATADVAGKVDAKVGGGIPGIASLTSDVSIGTAQIFKISAIVSSFAVPLMRLIDRCIEYEEGIKVPGIGEAINLYLRNIISDDEFRCMAELNGYDSQDAFNMADAARTRLDTRQWIDLWRRNQISEDQLNQSLRNVGWLNDTEVQGLKQLAITPPSTIEVIRMAIREQFDDAIIKKYGFDEGIDNAFQQTPLNWLNAHGNEDAEIQAHYYSHWRQPNEGLIIECLRRCRPDSQFAIDNNIVTTEDDIHQALKQDAIPKYWRDRLIALAQHVPTRIDLRRMFAQAVIDEERFTRGLTDLGYHGEALQAIVDLTFKIRTDTLRKHKWIQLYLRDGLNKQQTVERLQSEGYNAEEILESIDWVDSEADAIRRAECVTSLGTRFKRGDIDESTIYIELVNLGLDGAQAISRIESWKCAKKTSPKEEAAGVLCGWFSNGLLSLNDFNERLVRLGYSSEDSQRIMLTCNMKIAQKAEAAAEKAAKQSERQREKTIRDAERRQRDAERAAERQEKIRIALERLDARRKARLGELAEKVAALNGISMVEAASNISALLQGLMVEWPLMIDQVYSAFLRVLKTLPTTGPVDLASAVENEWAAFLNLQTNGSE